MYISSGTGGTGNSHHPGNNKMNTVTGSGSGGGYKNLGKKSGSSSKLTKQQLNAAQSYKPREGVVQVELNEVK